MDHVEAQVLRGVSELFADVFSALAAHWDEHRHYLDDSIRRFDREIQF